MTIKGWQVECHRIAKEKGWWDNGVENRNIFEIAALLHSEISEFVEDIRHGHLPSYYAFKENGVTVWHLPHFLMGKEKPIGPAIELADLAIRLFDTCEAYGIDLEEMVKIKCKYNETRPYRHGNKIA